MTAQHLLMIMGFGLLVAAAVNIKLRRSVAAIFWFVAATVTFAASLGAG